MNDIMFESFNCTSGISVTLIPNSNKGVQVPSEKFLLKKSNWVLFSVSYLICSLLSDYYKSGGCNLRKFRISEFDYP